ncbi:hypothetical protein B6U79_04685 [Candidatus Bathyarchaeota archaeon ex4484_231]|nr:MAG: hypothetical protein B6U79_04685 [Candidatus Bathyarchaeota archaeon ex4484_231]RJS76868.1 MAG: ArsR family transcriptional regulator [Candidatus Bathyarchaeota archaeon]
MTLKLQLVQDGEVIFEIPLSPSDWPKEQLKEELDSIEEDFDRFSRIFNAMSNETRLRMMKNLIQKEDQTMNFADFMHELELNPKLVWENARRLTEGGLLTKTGRGKYSCSEFGQRTFMIMSLALRRLIETLEELEKI